MTHEIDPTFLAIERSRLADAALGRARELGVEHADFRIERTRDASLRVHDAEVDGALDAEETGMAVRVVRDGTWGFAAGVDLTPEAAARLTELAVDVARASQAITAERVELADEAVYPDVVWQSSYDVNPFDIADAERIALLVGWSARLLASGAVDHADASVRMAQENKFYADLAGTITTQQRVRTNAGVEVVGVDPSSGAFETMRSIAPPVGRGWEYLTGTGWDWDAELDTLPHLLAEKMAAPTVDAGTYDLVIHPSNLWLTIHESIGHATELDRALGYEAAYAGTSFATFDKLGNLKYGSPVMHVTADRTAAHGLASVGYDDEGVASQSWDLVRDGMLVGYQIDRRMAQMKGLGRSNGCAYADSSHHVPIQRMANVSLQPASDGPTTDGLIAAVDDGVYVIGDKSWSIDMQRYNFQFTGQRFYRIRGGQVGGPSTYVLGGAFNCGKGQPGQVAAVSHGCPSALFRQVRILNTSSEAGR
ncbi:MAG: TldD protein [Acidimicrobiaceae bacterium]|nr:TldD protein [Acidimicrobiaceae bacterium]